MRNAPDKNPFKGVSDLLSRAAPANRNHHFLSYIIDIVLVAILSYLLFLGGNTISKNSDNYKTNYANYETEITYYQDMVVDAHISEYLSRDAHLLADREDISLKMAISQVLLSYTYDNPSSPEFLENPITKLKEIYTGSFYEDSFVEASFDNDAISKFIIDYVPLHNENNELIDYHDLSPESYTIIYHKKHANKYDKLKFIYSTDDSTLPYLRVDIASDLYDYLVRADGFTRDAYDYFVEFYTSMLTDAENIIFKAPTYQNGHYLDYLKYRKVVTQITNITLLISTFLAYLIVVLTPQLIFKDGRTLGRIFLRLAVTNTDKSEYETWKVIVRSVIGAISNFFIAFFLVLLPPFNGASLTLYLPFITIGSFDITLLNIVIVIFVLASVNGIFMLLTHEKRSLTDLIFKTVTVDVTALDEPDYDERNEAFL